MKSIDEFRDAPVWEPLSIENETKIGLNIFHKLKFTGDEK